MEHEELNEHISGLISRYDPDLTREIYPHELARILYAVDAYKDGYFLPIEQERESWGSGLHKYERVQICLRKAIHQTLGSELERIGEHKGSFVTGPLECQKDPRLLTLAEQGNPKARIYCAVGSYFQAISSLVNYPDVSRESVVEPLIEAGNMLPSFELNSAIMQRVNGIFDSGLKPSFAWRLTRPLLLLLCIAAVVGSTLIIALKLSKEHAPVQADALQGTQSVRKPIEWKPVEAPQPNAVQRAHRVIRKNQTSSAPAAAPKSARNQSPTPTPTSIRGRAAPKVAPASKHRPRFSRNLQASPETSSSRPPPRDDIF